jgi:GDP-4-dehydro-6-deoxy-D-mannose reductase
VGDLALRRDYSDVRDVVRAYALLLSKGRPGETYNVCSGRTTTLSRILQVLVSLSPRRIRVQIERSRFRKVDIPVLSGSNLKLRRETGWKPRIPLERTLADLLDGWRAALKD